MEGRDITVREAVNATKERFGEETLAGLFDGATRIVVAKGKKVLTFDPRRDSFDEISAVVLGPSGNLRAPAIRAGKTWLVGFNEAAYEEKFG